MDTSLYHELKYKCKNGWESWVCPWAKLSGLKGATEFFDKRKQIFLCHPCHFRFYVKIGTPKIANFTYQVSLPQGLTCSQCVVQWTYTTGNTWGKCDNGTEAIGCGPQVSKASEIRSRQFGAEKNLVASKIIFLKNQRGCWESSLKNKYINSKYLLDCYFTILESLKESLNVLLRLSAHGKFCCICIY